MGARGVWCEGLFHLAEVIYLFEEVLDLFVVAPLDGHVELHTQCMGITPRYD